MFRKLRVAIVMVMMTRGLVAQTTIPVEQLDRIETQNLQSFGGLPLSREAGNPPGSNGKAPVGNASTGIYAPPTAGQFRSLLSSGSGGGLTQAQWQAMRAAAVMGANSSAYAGDVALRMGVPVATNATGVVVATLRKVAVGRVLAPRRPTHAFGQVINVPLVTETGTALGASASTTYWLDKPHATSADAYYWSPHARKVYASASGPVFVTWMRAAPYTVATMPTNYVNLLGTQSFVTNGANVFLLFTQAYVVSATPVQQARIMYWTQKDFMPTGKPVLVPPARVTGIRVAYNASFPRTVAKEFVNDGSTSPTDGSTNNVLSELRTLWYEQQAGAIYAYNQEGRVLVELLGDSRNDGTYVQLGTEVVEVKQLPAVTDVTVELGERMVPPVASDVETLYPEPVLGATTESFMFLDAMGTKNRIAYYATRETRNLNDVLIHWMEAGRAGILWPKVYSRYALRWPADVSRYSIYVRPNAGSFEEAQATSVVLNSANAPTIEYQDPLDQPRARFTSDLRFYSFLSEDQPAHRTLLRYMSNDQLGFERVLSVRVGNLRDNTLGKGGVSTGLSAWNGTNFAWPDALKAPRILSETAYVGERIRPPAGEVGSGDDDEFHVPGFINPEVGNLYEPNAYLNPFVVGLDAASLGAIIPVNAVPGRNLLEVWWYRPSTSTAGLNTGNTAAGFTRTWWPSVVGRYAITWPTSPREIVLASRLGGAEARVEEAGGTIYHQNDPALPGYNPNEEHAIMSGGIPYATRDDLNLTGGMPSTYSSDPYVLVSYGAFDGRPAMAVYKVLREKPEAGFVFDYMVPAGQVVQPPPPLGFLAQPVVGSGDASTTLNHEPMVESQDPPGGWNESLRGGEHGHYIKFTWEDRKHNLWVYRGPHGGLPSLMAGRYDSNANSFGELGTIQVGPSAPFAIPLHASRQSEFLALTITEGPSWVTASGLDIVGAAPVSEGTHWVKFLVRDRYDGAAVAGQFTLQVASGGEQNVPARMSITSVNPFTGSVVTFTNRPPFLARSPSPANSFTLRYYYRTEPSFAWPGVAGAPAAGSIVPYLRPRNASGQWEGDPAASNTESLDIVYRPYWPERDPKDSSKGVATLPYGATLAGSVNGLPAVRDFKTAHVLYQQSIARNLEAPVPSVVLHDPTRAKYSDIAAAFPDTGKIPGSIQTTLYQGRYYFPALPPHLQSRLFVDPNRGSKGALVLVGEYKKETLGESYLLLNLLNWDDLAAVKEICPGSDSVGRPKWDQLVEALSTDVETLVEGSTPRVYLTDTNLTSSVGVGVLAEIKNPNSPVDSYALSATGPGDGYVTLVEASGTALTDPGDPVSMHVFRVGGNLHRGEIKVIPSENPLSEKTTFQFSGDLAGRDGEYEYEWKIAAPVNGQPPSPDATMSRYLTLRPVSLALPRVMVGGAGVQALGDNYVVMRYRPMNPSHPLFKSNPSDSDWSAWTPPVLAEGWIKRVLAGINPFNQRVKDLFNNRLNTDVSLLTQAGKRWEGDVALNLDTMNSYGLIEIYETVLRRGKMLSIESGFNYGPANDALLLAAGYLNDLYMLLGNEAWADAANPTIGIGTADKSFGDIATSLFAFRGQVSTLLEEELGLLRGRDDFLMPGVDVAPVYNRMFWNYTRGIDSGEVIYALNYNIKEKADSTSDGVIDATDAAYLYPQGHGDAYGHYLTALKGYYTLLLNSNFDWVPRVEAVNVLGKAVTVDYEDERKFAAAAAAVARAGRQIFDLTWRKDYLPVASSGWSHLYASRTNPDKTYLDQESGQTLSTARQWGADHWASRVGQGAYVHWLAGNAIIPSVDPDPTHEGIQRVDRSTVPELNELVSLATGLNAAVDNSEGGLSPLGVSEGGLAFDLDPNAVVGGDEGSHFEQLYKRAKKALSNAVVAFDDAKDVTRLMRSESDSLLELQASIARQEAAYTAQLIELYGTPYPDDVGPGQMYKQGYEGPDLMHYSYVEMPEYDFPELKNYTASTEWRSTKILNFDPKWLDDRKFKDFNFVRAPVDDTNTEWTADGRVRNGIAIEKDDSGKDIMVLRANIGPAGYAVKPSSWKSKRRSPGRMQQAISKAILAHGKLRYEICMFDGDTYDLGIYIQVFNAHQKNYEYIRNIRNDLLIARQVMEKVEFADDLYQAVQDALKDDLQNLKDAISEAIPKSLIAGVAAGGDMTAPARGAVKTGSNAGRTVLNKLQLARTAVRLSLELAVNTAEQMKEFYDIALRERDDELMQACSDLVDKLGGYHNHLWTINERLRELDDARASVDALVAQGDRIQAEREVFRRRTATVVQGYRTRDAAFRFFRNEKLERYKTLQDLAARYALLAANAYDYETGLLGTSAGRQFIRGIVASRSLGVIRNGEPQFAGSAMGDPGLSSALASMKADWDVLRGRLGFNNPDAYGTTVSMRTENLRILPTADGDTRWRDAMQAAYVPDLLRDADIQRHCLQIDDGSGLPIPGFVFSFSTEIAKGKNLFGQPLAAGDSYLSPASFATKIFASGVALEGYRGMAGPASNGGVVGTGGGVSPVDPGSWFLDPLGLSATPYVYLIPVGVDLMRSPPLGDQGNVRSWLVDDIAVPIPFNIGASDFATRKLWQSSDSLTESLFEIRKHQPFRAVPSAASFAPGIYGGLGTLRRTEFTNNRLVGRSVWNSQWKLVIPAHALLANPDEGVDRFLQTIKDIKLHFVTYSYSGN